MTAFNTFDTFDTFNSSDEAELRPSFTMDVGLGNEHCTSYGKPISGSRFLKDGYLMGIKGYDSPFHVYGSKFNRLNVTSYESLRIPLGIKLVDTSPKTFFHSTYFPTQSVITIAPMPLKFPSELYRSIFTHGRPRLGPWFDSRNVISRFQGLLCAHGGIYPDHDTEQDNKPVEPKEEVQSYNNVYIVAFGLGVICLASTYFMTYYNPIMGSVLMS